MNNQLSEKEEYENELKKIDPSCRNLKLFSGILNSNFGFGSRNLGDFVVHGGSVGFIEFSILIIIWTQRMTGV